MKIITFTKYQSNDGQLWDNKKDCEKADIKHDFEKSLPEEIKKMRELLIELLEIENSFKKKWFVIGRTPTLNKEIRWHIAMAFSCSNHDYTRAIGNFLASIAGMPHSYVSFSEYQKYFCSLQIHKGYSPEGYTKDLQFLENLLTKREKKHRKSLEK